MFFISHMATNLILGDQWIGYRNYNFVILTITKLLVAIILFIDKLLCEKFENHSWLIIYNISFESHYVQDFTVSCDTMYTTIIMFISITMINGAHESR